MPCKPFLETGLFLLHFQVYFISGCLIIVECYVSVRSCQLTQSMSRKCWTWILVHLHKIGHLHVHQHSPSMVLTVAWTGSPSAAACMLAAFYAQYYY